MANMRISWPNRLGSATFTATPGVWSSLPASNLATTQIAQVARSIGLTNVHAYVDAGAAVEVGVFAAVGHNLTTVGDIRLRGWTANPRGSYWYDFDPTNPPVGPAFTAPGALGTFGGTYWGADGLLKLNASATGFSTNARYTHTELTGGECLGVLLEPGRTNNVLQSRDGSNASWTKANCTATRTATGIDGAANTATRVTATSATGRISQAIVLGAATRRFSLYARRVTGTGTVSITVDAFAATTTITLTSAWQRFDMTSTGANPTVGVQIATSGDAIEIDCLQLEDGAYPTTPIHTTTATVSRAADAFTITVPANTSSTMLVRLKCIRAPTSEESVISLGSSALTTGRGITCDTTPNFVAKGSSASVAQWSLGSALATTERTYGISAASNDIACSLDGGAVTTDVSATVTSETTITSQNSRTGVYTVKMIAHWSTAASDAETVALSGTLAPSTADYDSTATDAWPAAWVSGTTAEQRTGVVGCAVLAPAATYRYWRLDLIDAANPDGYIEVGRLFGGSAWSPTINAIYGAGIAYESRDVVTEMDSGSEYTRARPAPRVVQFALPGLTDSETISTVLDMQRRQGSSGEVLFEFDPADTLYAPTRRFLARLRRVSPLRAIFVDRWECDIEVKELL